VQKLQGVVLAQRFCNNNKAIGADFVRVLQKKKSRSKIKHLCNIKKISATHKVQRIHGAVVSHSLCNVTGTIGANVVVTLQKNCGSVEFRK
jgi:hypothetical protein